MKYHVGGTYSNGTRTLFIRGRDGTKFRVTEDGERKMFEAAQFGKLKLKSIGDVPQLGSGKKVKMTAAEKLINLERYE